MERAEAKQALTEAILSAVMSPDGLIAPDLLRAAEATGVPRNKIIDGVKVARQRVTDMAANQGQKQLQQQRAQGISKQSQLQNAPAQQLRKEYRPPSQQPLPLIREGTNPSELTTILWKMKHHRDCPEMQSLCCKALYIIAESLPSVFDVANGSNFHMEAPLSVLLACKRHQRNTSFDKSSAYWALIQLLGTACLDGIFKFGGAEVLIACLKDDEMEVDFRSYCLIEIAKCTDQTNNVDALVKAGYTGAVQELMKANPKNGPVQNICFFILGSVIGKDDAEILHDIDGIVSSIRQFPTKMGEEGLVYPSQGLRLIHEIMAADPRATSNAVTRAGGREVVLSLMKNYPDHPGVQAECCKTLRCFVGELSRECFDAILLAMGKHEKEVDVQGPASFVLSKFSDSEPGAILMKNSDAVSKIFSSMIMHPTLEDPQFAGCRVVHNMLHWRETRMIVSTVEAAVLVVSALKRHNHLPHFRILGLQIIHSLLAQGEGNTFADSIVEAGGIEVVAKATQCSKKTKRYTLLVCTILHVLSGMDDGIKLQVAKQGGARAILDLMKGRPKHQELQQCGCKALGILTTYRPAIILEAISKANGVDIILDAIENFPKDRDIFNYGGSAALHARGYENEQKKKLKL